MPRLRNIFEMSAAKKYLPHYTVDDYAQWEGDWELWDGIAVSRCPKPDGTPRGMSPSPFGPHQATATNLIFELKLRIRDSGCDAAVLSETDWIVSNDTIVRPDVVVLCDGIPERHIESTPVLVAEILSDSTRQLDQTNKRDLYDQQGVGVYLLLDPDTETLECYSRDSMGKWQHQVVSDSIEFSICKDCKIHLDRCTLFAR